MSQQPQETIMSGFESKKQMAESRWIDELEADGEDVILPFTITENTIKLLIKLYEPKLNTSLMYI